MLQAQITARINAFANELHALVMKEAVAAVSAALGTTPAAAPRPGVRSPAPSRRRRSRGRSRPAAPATAAAATPAASPAAKAKAAPKAKPAPKAAAKPGSSPNDGAIVDYVKANPGARVEQMVKALGVPTEKLKARVSDLVAAKAIKKTGKTRGTKYFPV